MNLLKPFFTYYGGKYRIAPKYPPPSYSMLIEPFAGSAGYALRYPSKQVKLYELDPRVFGTWDYLIRVSQKEILNLPLVIEDVRDLLIPQEAKWLIGWWLNKGNSMPCNLPSLWMRSGTRPNSYWGKVIRNRIASQLDAIRHWEVYNCSYTDIPGYKATWFIDPPYERSGKCYSFKDIDYSSLRQWCQARKGQTIVCEQQGATWLPFKPFIETRGTPGYKMPGTSKEMIWTNT